jgi:hypothetical protein
MGLPQKLEGSKYAVLRIRNTYLVFDTNGQKKLIESIHYYAPAAMCGGTPFQASSKNLLVTYSTGITYGGVTYYGFQTTVTLALNAVLQKAALPGGIFAKWYDVPTDLDAQCGTLAPGTIPPTAATVGNGGTTGGGVGASLASRMPMDNHVTFRKFTGIAGKEWSRGRWKFCPIDESQVGGDELTAGAQTAWAALKAPLYAAITDGTTTNGVPNLLYPILVSTKLSQVRRSPTRICYAPLVLPGLNYITQLTNPIINLTIGEQRRRKEKPVSTF